MVGAAGFEPAHGGIKTHCLTTWLRPIKGLRLRGYHAIILGDIVPGIQGQVARQDTVQSECGAAW